MPDPLRFQKEYGVPPGRSAIAKKPLDYLYRVEEVLDSGCGANAIGGLNNGVFLVRHVKSGKHRVQKCIPAHTSMPDSSMLEREILLLEVLRHPNVVGFVDACITDTVPRQMSLYMEYCDLGSLQKMIKRYTNHNANRLATPGRQQQQQQPPTCFSVPEAFVWHVLHSLASALQYLHHGIAGNDRREPPEPKDLTEWPPILHRDIKPDNILLRTAPGVLSLYKDTSQPSVYPHWPFNNEDPEGGDRTYPKIVLADFVSAIALLWHFFPSRPFGIISPFELHKNPLPSQSRKRKAETLTTSPCPSPYNRESQPNIMNPTSITPRASLARLNSPRPSSQKPPVGVMCGRSGHRSSLSAGFSLMAQCAARQRITRTDGSGIWNRNADVRWHI